MTEFSCTHEGAVYRFDIYLGRIRRAWRTPASPAAPHEVEIELDQVPLLVLTRFQRAIEGYYSV